jgi:hypothetical protein
LLPAVLCALPLGAETRAQPTPKAPAAPAPASLVGVPVARVAIVAGNVEQSATGRDWQPAQDGHRLKTGDRLRTGPDAVARIEFPWTAVSVGPGSTIQIPGGVVLSTVLEAGRVEVHSGAGEIIKVRTADVQVRGRGHVVVRRSARVTLVSVLDGGFRVEAQGRATSVNGGQGARVETGSAVSVSALAPPPDRLVPGADPAYVLRDTPVTLSWNAPGETFHLQVLALDSDNVLLERDVTGLSDHVSIPWLGTFRWRVARRDDRGMEGVLSPPGYVCVVDK